MEPKNTMYQKLLDATRQLSTQTIIFHQHVAKSLGLNITDHKCLDIVLGMGKVTAGQLAELTGLTTGAITNVLNRLEKAGFIRRAKDPNDKRIVYVEPVYDALTPLFEVFAPLAEAMTDLHAKYSEEQLHLLLDYIERSKHLLIHQRNRLQKNVVADAERAQRGRLHDQVEE